MIKRTRLIIILMIVRQWNSFTLKCMDCKIIRILPLEALATYEKQIKIIPFKLLAGTSVEQSNNKGLEGYRNTFQ